MDHKKVVFSLLLSFFYTHRCASKISNLQKRQSIILLIFFITPLVGCALDTKVKSDFETKTDSSESLTNSIQNPQYKIAVVADSNDDKFAKCVERGLRSRLRKSTVISEEKFRDEIYPHTQLCDRPSSAVQVYELLGNPKVHLKLLDIELDFIVYVGGSTNWKGRDGYITPPLLPLPIWFGYTQKERKTNIRTTILDINKAKLLGKAFVRSKGIVAIPIAGLWIPIPIGLATESSACNKTAQHITNSLVRRSLYSHDVVKDDSNETKVDTSMPNREAIHLSLLIDSNSRNVDDVRRLAIEDNTLDQSQLTKTFSTPTGSDPVNRWYIDELKRLANEDSAEDQFTLGLMYYKGNRVEHDHLETIKWWLKAAEQGHVEAQYRLGLMYLEVNGAIDNAEAARWLKKASGQGLEAATEALELIPDEAKN